METRIFRGTVHFVVVSFSLLAAFGCSEYDSLMYDEAGPSEAARMVQTQEAINHDALRHFQMSSEGSSDFGR